MKTQYGRDINCGRFWTLLTVECYLYGGCNKKCRYWNFCNRANVGKKPFILKYVVLMLKEKCGEPPEYLLKQAKSDDLYL